MKVVSYLTADYNKYIEHILWRKEDYNWNEHSEELPIYLHCSYLNINRRTAQLIEQIIYYTSKNYSYKIYPSGTFTIRCYPVTLSFTETLIDLANVLISRNNELVK